MGRGEHHRRGWGPLVERMTAHKFVNLKSSFGLSWLEKEPWPVNLLTKSMSMSVVVCANCDSGFEAFLQFP
jgi:hypothetical protein